MTKDPANFREYSASLACFILIMAAIALIFAIILVPVYTGNGGASTTTTVKTS